MSKASGIFYAWRKPRLENLIKSLIKNDFQIDYIKSIRKKQGFEISDENTLETISAAKEFKISLTKYKPYASIYIHNKYASVSVPTFALEPTQDLLKEAGFSHRSPLWFWFVLIGFCSVLIFVFSLRLILNLLMS